jgi:hypothetical protein
MAWELIVIGMFFALALILIQSPSPMLIAVGMYLPFPTVMAIFAGGLIKWVLDSIVKRKTRGDAKRGEAVENRGLLVASGLVAGEALVGILLAAVVALNVKFFCDDSFQKEAGAAQGFMTRIERVEGTPAERAQAILADTSLARLAEVQGKDARQLAGFIGKQESLADTRCLGDEPGWFHQAWLGFLIILGLALYMILTSLRALRPQKPRDGGASPGADPPPAVG